MLQARLPFAPAGAQEVSRDLAVLLDEVRLTVFNASGPIFTCARDDQGGLRLAAAMFSDMGLARPTALARALEMHPATVFRSRQRLEAGGIEGLRTRKPGPKGPSKLTEAVRAQVRRRLAQGWSLRRVAAEVGVVEGTLRHAIRRGDIQPAGEAPRRPTSAGIESLARPAERGARDQSCEAGIAVKRTEERAFARIGLLPEATPQLRVPEILPSPFPEILPTPR